MADRQVATASLVVLLLLLLLMLLPLRSNTSSDPMLVLAINKYQENTQTSADAADLPSAASPRSQQTSRNLFFWNNGGNSALAEHSLEHDGLTISPKESEQTPPQG